jgi:hypothetical protein
MALVHLGCPSCGGTLAVAEGQRICDCRYCGRRSLVLAPNAVPRYVVGRAIDREGAVAAARGALQHPGVPRSVRERTRFDTITLCYVPFYESTAVRLGTVFMRERVKPPAPLAQLEWSGEALDRWLADPGVEREDTRVLEQDVLRVGPACELPELGVERIGLTGLRQGGSPHPLSTFDPVALQSRAVVFAPTRPAERFLEEAAWRMPSQHDATRYVEARLKLLYYPVWQARYRYRGRLYELAVDGLTGSLLRGSAPRAQRRPATPMAAGLALGTLGVGRILRWLVAGGETTPLFLLAALAGGALFWMAWRSLEQGSEIELGSS